MRTDLLHKHTAAICRNGLRCNALLVELCQYGGIEIDRLVRHRRGATATRIGVDLEIDQFGDRPVAVAGHVDVLPLGAGHHPVANHQEAVFNAGHELLDDDGLLPPSFTGSHGKSAFDLLAAGEVQEHAPSVVPVGRLDDDGHADCLRGLPGLGCRRDHTAKGHRYACRREHVLRQLLIDRDALGDRRRAIGHRGPDAALANALAELHHALPAEPAPRNAAGCCGTDDQHRARADADVVGELREAIDGGREIRQVPREFAVQDRGSLAEARLREHRVVGFEDDPKQSGLARRHHPQECSRRRACRGLQRERDLSEQPRQIGAEGFTG